MPPLTSDLLWDVVKHIPRAKAQGLDAWSPDDLKALPREAFDDLADVLTQVEAEGKWPEGLSGAIVALLPKKDDHWPLAQRPISLLPMVYRLWAAARVAILKEWFAREGHASAWGQGIRIKGLMPRPGWQRPRRSLHRLEATMLLPLTSTARSATTTLPSVTLPSKVACKASVD